jgi:predicted PurR-regulated permease PerM
MFEIDLRALRVLWTIFVFGLVLLLLYAIRETLILFAVAIFFAYIIAPMVGFLQRIFFSKRIAALTIVYVLLIAMLVTVSVTAGSTIGQEAASLQSKLPNLLQHGALSSVPLPGWLSPLRSRLLQFLETEVSSLGAKGAPVVHGLVWGIGSIFAAVLVPVISFFLLKDASRIRSILFRRIRKQASDVPPAIVTDIHVVLSRYVRALLVLAAASFLAWFIFLTVLGAQYTVLLAAVAGVLEFIPLVGPITACVIIFLVSALSGVHGLLWIVVFAAGFRLIQDYVIQPNVVGSGVELSPLLVLFGVLAGKQIGGIPGIFFSIPVIAILKTIWVRFETEGKSPVKVAD